MIPKTIHYCWFGRNPLPEMARLCIASWEKYCPGYEIIRWDEDNFDLSACPEYVRQAYEAKKWSFVTDYVRLKVVYDHGGIYMDTDVELTKPLDKFLPHRAYFGFEDGTFIATGLGFGAEMGLPLLKEMMADYEIISFIQPDGSFDHIPCPKRNTQCLLKYGLKQNNSRQVLEGDILILPSDYFCPKSYETGLLTKTRNTHSIHHYDASWFSAEQQDRKHQRWQEQSRGLHYWTHLPLRLLQKLLGMELYLKLRTFLRPEHR